MTAPSRSAALVGLAATVLAPLLASPALAQQPPSDVRRVELVDGRTYLGEVVTTEPGGIRLRLPQGETLVGFHELKKLAASDASAWSGQRDWEVVVVGPDEARRWVEGAVRTYPAVVVAGDSGLSRPAPPASVSTARACDPANLGCAVSALSRDGDWTWIVTVQPSDDGGATLQARTSLGSAGGRVSIDALRDPAVLLPALDDLLGLVVVPGRDDAEARLMAMGGEKGKDRSRDKDKKDKRRAKDKDKDEGDAGDDTRQARADKPPKPPRPPREPAEIGALDALVPVPGYPALKAGDMQSFGVAMAVALPVTAAWVGATGNESTSIPEHAALGLGGFYLTTLVVNHVIGARLGKTGIAVDARRDGASVRIALPLR